MRKQKKQKISAILISISIIVGILVVSSPKTVIHTVKLRQSAISNTIHIIGNSGWVDFRNAGNCTGLGTYSDPYIIEDLVIEGVGSKYCIWIQNSDVFFRIENCTVSNSGDYPEPDGILLTNVTNSILINNTCFNNYEGIYLWDSNNNTISGNIVENNERYGIDLYNSNHNTIIRNKGRNNGATGIELLESDNNNILNNVMNENEFDGIFLWASNNNTLLENTLNNNRRGIRIYFSNFSSVIKNNASNNIVGIKLEYNNRNNITENWAHDNHIGIYLQASCYNSILYNSLIGNVICIKLEEECYGNVFEHNDCGNKDELIPGYNLFILFGILSLATILIIKKREKYCKYTKKIILIYVI